MMRGRRVGLSVSEIRDSLDLYEEEGEGAQNAHAIGVFHKRIEALEAQREAVEEAIEALRQASGRLKDRFFPEGSLPA